MRNITTVIWIASFFRASQFSLESEAALEELHRVVAFEGNHAKMLRDRHAKSGGALGLVDGAVRMFRAWERS